MGDGGPGRKSKRVAKRAEDDMFWLMHNFPKGIDYNDSSCSKNQTPKSTSKLICSVNEKIKDLKHSVNSPAAKTLRSGKMIKRAQISDEDNSSDEEKAPKAEEKPMKSRSPRKRIKKDDDDIDLESLPPELRAKHENIIKAKLPKFKAQPDKLSTRSGAQYPFTWNPSPKPTTPKSTAVTVTAPKPTISKPTTPDPISTIPVPSTPIPDTPIPDTPISDTPKPTTSKPTEPISRNSKSVAPKSTPPKQSSFKVKTVIIPRSEPLMSHFNMNGKPEPSIKKSSQNAKPARKSKLQLNRASLLPPLIKDEPTSGDSEDSTYPPHLLHSTYPRFMWNLTPTKHSIRKSSPKVNKSKTNGLISPVRKRKKLSLLPMQQEDKYEVFNSTWLDALNSPDSSSSSIVPSPRSESPRSTASSEISIPEKRVGRTASLNCRAVLSALIKTEPNTKKMRKSPCKMKLPKLPKADANNKFECKPDSYFGVRVNSQYTSKIDFHHNGLHCKIYNPPSFLKIHEENILEEFKNVRISTNGWQWIGSYVECSSFYNTESKETTRLYFSAMSRDNVVLRVGDSVALQAGEIEPFVGKIISMWQDNLGEMMVTMCWFYRPSDLENIKSEYGKQELYLSKHTDDNSVATIQDKVYVISYPEYCRYHSFLQQRRTKRDRGNVVPNVKMWREDLLPSYGIQLDVVYFCRGVYDFRLGRTLKQHFYYTKYL